MADPLSSLIRPDRGPSLPSLDRFAPPPPGNLVVAEIEARSSPRDVVIALHGRGGWIARAAIGRLRRAYVHESTALTRLAAEVVLRPPDLRHFDAAVNALAAQPRGEVGLRQALNELFSSRCATCERMVVVDEFIDLGTPRTLVSIEAILSRLDQDLRAAPIEAALRLALLHVLLPASRLNSYPGRLAALRIVGGHVRPPGDRQWRERNPWLLFEDGCRLVRGFIQRLEGAPGGAGGAGRGARPPGRRRPRGRASRAGWSRGSRGRRAGGRGGRLPADRRLPG